jgi:hypothetical protein
MNASIGSKIQRWNKNATLRSPNACDCAVNQGNRRKLLFRHLGTKRISATTPTMSVSRAKAHLPRLDSPTSENDQRAHPLRTIYTTRTVADAEQGTPMTDREKILIALREKPLKAFEIMKRVNIKHQDDCQSLLLKMRDDGVVKFDIHKGHWLAA